MIYFEDLEKISNVVCKVTPSLYIKHVVNLKQENPKTNTKMDFAFYYSFPNTTNPNDVTQGIQFRMNSSYLILENVSYKRDVKTGTVKPAKTRISINISDTPNLTNHLDIALSWLTLSNDQVFQNDTIGRPVKVYDPNLRTACPLLKEPTGIVFKPCIVQDDQGNKYQGISIGNREKGEITSLTATEFYTLKTTILNVLNNLYISNITSVNQALNYCLYKNFMEVVRRDGSSKQG